MTSVEIQLNDGESFVADENELIYRQITQHMITKDGQIGSHAFGASNADRGMPSYSRSTLVSAQDARNWHTANANSPSLSVWGLTVGEVAEVKRIVVDDSGTPLPDGVLRAPGHCFIDLRNLTTDQIKSIRAVLLRAALQRGEIPTLELVADPPLF